MPLKILLFNLTPRLYLERIVIISSLLSSLWIAFKLVDAAGVFAYFSPSATWIVLYVFITLHHLISLVGPLRFFYGFFDFVFLVTEIVGVSAYTSIIPAVRSWTPEMLTLHALFVWMTLISLIFLGAFRLATVVRSRGKALITPFNVFSEHRLSPLDQKPTFFHMCMGRSLWKAKFVGETKAVILTRGLLGLLFIATIVFWIITSVLLQPLKETALSPIREFRTTTPPSDFVDKIESPAWNIILPTINTSAMSQDHLKKVMRIEALWNLQAGPSCTLNTTFVSEYKRSYHHFICQSIRLNDTNWLPNLNVVINSFKPHSLADEILRQDYLPILIGMTNGADSIKHIIQTTTPFAMLYGVSVVASIIPAIRQVFISRGLASLGIFQLSTTFWDPRMVATYHDPAWNSAGTHKSSLRIIFQYDSADWSGVRIIQDYRQNSVFSGFASVGGLWASLSGFFTLMFGASMLHIISGAKPLSIFGAAHSFQYQHMKEEILRLYPNILKEGMDLDDRGLLALLRDHLIDLSFLEKDYLEKQNPKNDVEQPQAEKEKNSEVSGLL